MCTLVNLGRREVAANRGVTLAQVFVESGTAGSDHMAGLLLTDKDSHSGHRLEAIEFHLADTEGGRNHRRLLPLQLTANQSQELTMRLSQVLRAIEVEHQIRHGESHIRIHGVTDSKNP